MAYTESPEKQKNISRAVALNDACLIVKEVGLNTGLQTNKEITDSVLAIADTFLEWLTRKEPNPEADKIGAELVDVVTTPKVKRPRSVPAIRRCDECGAELTKPNDGETVCFTCNEEKTKSVDTFQI